MNNVHLAVREIQEIDIEPITQYWMTAEDHHLRNMGADPAKMPSEAEWKTRFAQQIQTPLEQKASYCIVWLVNNQPIGHSNVNNIVFGQEATMHLHIWDASVRRKGYGVDLIKMTLPYFFNNLQLKTLYCEPYALNPAPNKTLEKVGFTFVKEYVTVPGSINFEQPVKRWALSLEAFKKIQ